MMDFEDQLRSALSREEPGADFARKVLARTASLERRRAWEWRPWAAGCMAASLLLGGIGFANLEQRERERGLMARAQLVRALGITSSRLHRIERKLEGLNQ